MADPTCKTCQFFSIHNSDPTLEPIGDCRRNSPVVGDAPATFPTTYDDEWCGEHKPSVSVTVDLDAKGIVAKIHENMEHAIESLKQSILKDYEKPDKET